jgi:DNA-binding CsgD family transcriptional regulator
MDHLQLFSTLLCVFLTLLAFLLVKYLASIQRSGLLTALQHLAITLFVYEVYSFAVYYRVLNMDDTVLFPAAISKKLVAFITLVILLTQRALLIRISSLLTGRMVPFRLRVWFGGILVFLTLFFGAWLIVPGLFPWFRQTAIAFRHLLAGIELLTMVLVLRESRRVRDHRKKGLLTAFALLHILGIVLYAIRWPLHQSVQMTPFTRLLTQAVFPLCDRLILPLWLWFFLLPWLARTRLVTSVTALSPDLDPFGLTRREQEVLAILLKGRTNQAIADELFVSEHTIKNLITGIYVKLGVNNRKELFHRFLAGEKRGGTPG